MDNKSPGRRYLSPALPRVFAHRGFAVAPGVSENTIPAFFAALELGATHIETDVQVTKDGVPVLFHDIDLFRVAGIERKIHELTSDQLAEVWLSDGGRVPTLREALVELPEARFNLDLKVWAAIQPVTELVRELNANDRVLLSSFSERRRAAAISALGMPVVSSAGGMRVLGLWAASKLGLESLIHRLAKPVHALQIPTGKGLIRFDSPAFISSMTQAGLELHYWTINDADEMRRLIGLGAHGIVTDRTDVAVNTLGIAI
jgi:glycerophosphoryl diester phosphodiesterase